MSRPPKKRWPAGDFWDIFADDNGPVAFVIGDVMGHGLTAAVFTAEIRFILRAFLREHEQPARVLSHLNGYLCGSRRLFREGLNDEGLNDEGLNDAPLCLMLAIVSAATGAGLVASAGMGPPLVVRAGGQVEKIPVVGLLLGIEGDQDYQGPGLSSDGVSPGTRRHAAADNGRHQTTDGITEARQGSAFLDSEGLMRLAGEAQPRETLGQMGWGRWGSPSWKGRGRLAADTFGMTCAMFGMPYALF